MTPDHCAIVSEVTRIARTRAYAVADEVLDGLQTAPPRSRLTCPSAESLHLPEPAARFYNQLQETIAKQRTQIVQLEAEIAELRKPRDPFANPKVQDALVEAQAAAARAETAREAATQQLRNVEAILREPFGPGDGLRQALGAKLARDVIDFVGFLAEARYAAR